jgi:hypothetical protein
VLLQAGDDKKLLQAASRKKKLEERHIVICSASADADFVAYDR